MQLSDNGAIVFHLDRIKDFLDFRDTFGSCVAGEHVRDLIAERLAEHGEQRHHCSAARFASRTHRVEVNLCADVGRCHMPATDLASGDPCGLSND